MARDARRAIDESRDVLAELLGAAPSDVVFTSGGTEADNLAVLGALDARGGVAVCSAVEHHAVLDAVVGRGGRLAPTDAAGVVDLERLGDVLDDDVTIVSVMMANNETGVVQPLADIAELVRRRSPNALFHTDAVQAFCWLDVAALASVADLISVSAHKFGGPKGVGALVARRGVAIVPRAVGGGQERGLRSGTQNVAGIAGMAVAARETAAERDATVARVALLRDRLAAGLCAAPASAIDTVDGRAPRIAGIAHLLFEEIESESLLFVLEDEGVAASAASSCSSGAMASSHVLGSMGVPADRAGGALRLSLGWSTTADDVDAALEIVPRAVARLRALVGGR